MSAGGILRQAKNLLLYTASIVVRAGTAHHADIQLTPNSMNMSDIWMAALVRLGEDETVALRKVTAVSALAYTKEGFDRWNAAIPESAGKPMLAAIAGPAGEALAAEIIEHSHTVLSRRFDVSTAQLECTLSRVA